jgi:hypothetical protein
MAEPENPYTLPDDPGLEVYQNQSGTISIKQEDSLGNEPAIVLVTPERVDRLIGFLRAVKDEILTQRADAAAEENSSAGPRLSL